jgi:hypothetical protein
MTVISVCLVLLLPMSVFLVYLFFRRQKEGQFPALGTQRMCPHCGRITARAHATCLECGGRLAQLP